MLAGVSVLATALEGAVQTGLDLCHGITRHTCLRDALHNLAHGRVLGLQRAHALAQLFHRGYGALLCRRARILPVRVGGVARLVCILHALVPSASSFEES